MGDFPAKWNWLGKWLSGYLEKNQKMVGKSCAHFSPKLPPDLRPTILRCTLAPAVTTTPLKKIFFSDHPGSSTSRDLGGSLRALRAFSTSGQAGQFITGWQGKWLSSYLGRFRRRARPACLISGSQGKWLSGYLLRLRGARAQRARKR